MRGLAAGSMGPVDIKVIQENGRIQGKEGRGQEPGTKKGSWRPGGGSRGFRGSCQSRVGKDAYEEGQWTVPSLPSPHSDLCRDLAGGRGWGGGRVCQKPSGVRAADMGLDLQGPRASFPPASSPPPPGSSCTDDWGGRSRVRPRSPQDGWSPRLAADKAGGTRTWDKLPSLLKPQFPQ